MEYIQSVNNESLLTKQTAAKTGSGMNEDSIERRANTHWGPNPSPNIQARTSSQDEFVFRLTQDGMARQIRILELHQVPSLADVKEDVEMLVTILDRLQKRHRNTARFHLIMEKDIAPSHDGASAADDGAHVETRILFSPTISFQGQERKSVAEKLADCLTTFAILDKRVPTKASYGVGFPFANAPQPPPTSPPPPPFAIPNWYPGKEHLQNEVTEQRWQELIQTKLHVNKDIARRFYLLGSHDISQIYKRFFKTLHTKIKALNRCRMQRTLVYAEFTPPWIRRRICVGEQTSYLVRLTIPDLRNQRNRAGYQRMAFILGAFYELEAMFSREILENLLSDHHIPTLRQSGNANKKRSAHAARLASPRAIARRKRNMAEGVSSDAYAGEREAEEHCTQQVPQAQPVADDDDEDGYNSSNEDAELCGNEGDTLTTATQDRQICEASDMVLCATSEDCVVLRKGDEASAEEARRAAERGLRCFQTYDGCQGREDGEAMCRKCKAKARGE